MITVERSVDSDHAVAVVSAYLSDFTTTATWDPHTRSCTRLDDGPLREGTRFDNTQQLGPLRTTLRYTVQTYEPGRQIVLVSRSRALHATDRMRFEERGSGTRVVYTAQFDLRGAARLAEPLLRRVMDSVADDGAAGMRRALAALDDSIAPPGLGPAPGAPAPGTAPGARTDDRP